MTASLTHIEYAPVPGRSRSVWYRARAVFLSLFTLFLAAVVGITAAPQANAQLQLLLIPIAKAAGGTALSWGVAEGVEAIWNTATPKDWGPDGPTKAQKKAGNGKWGSKLSGNRASLALGLLGGAASLALDPLLGDGDGDDGDGYRMPRDLQEDVSSIGTEPEPGRTGTIASFTAEGIWWTMHPGNATNNLAPYPSVVVEGSCRVPGAYESTRSSWCNEGAYIQGWAIEATCYNSLTGAFYNELGRLTFTGISAGRTNGHALCGATKGVGGAPDPVFSVRIVEDSDSAAIPARRGIAPLLESFNPNFQVPGVDPAVMVTAEVECVNPDTAAVQMVSRSVAGVDVLPVASCPVGWVPRSINWVGQTQKTDGSVNQEWLGGVQQSTSTEYPECPPGMCMRIIKVDDQACDATRPECYDWLKTTAPERVKCEYGPYALGLEQCADLEHIHKSTWGIAPNPDPEMQPSWLPANPDGTPNHQKTTEVIPDETDNPNYIPPTPGRWANPGTEPGTEPTSTAAPGPGGTPGTDPGGDSGTQPGTGGSGFPSSGWNPQNDSENCIAGAWSWNPIDWVYVPVKCAMSWAFVPKPGVAAQKVSQFQTQYSGTGAAAWTQLPSSVMADLPRGESGCRGPALNMPEVMGDGTYYPLDACTAPMSQYASMSKALVSLLVVVFGGMALANAVSTAVVGYPVFRRESTPAVSAA